MKSANGWSTCPSNGKAIQPVGFDAMPGGYRDDMGSFSLATKPVGYYWSSSSASWDPAKIVVSRFLQCNNTSQALNKYMLEATATKGFGYSIRCVK